MPGGPARETLPDLDLLAAVNRAGFVTENSQAAAPGWTAWVCGFADAGAARRLAAAAAGTRLTVEDMPRAGAAGDPVLVPARLPGRQDRDRDRPAHLGRGPGAGP